MVPLLQTHGLGKAYTVPVLDGFDFTLQAGEVHALVGSNGAGKSTFARILCGMTAPDQGKMVLEGKPWSRATRNDARASGVIMVLQELNLIPTLSIAENLFLERLPHRWGWIDRTRLGSDARRALERVGLGNLDPGRLLSTLGVGHQQMIEIAAALDQTCRVLILDEPTAALTDKEITELFRQINRLRESGVGIIYISHRMAEIRKIADRVTVLRDGHKVAEHVGASLDLSQVIRDMAGQAVTQNALNPCAVTHGPVVLEARGLRSPVLHGVDLSVRSGEILGLAGLVGSGRTEVLRALFGADRPDSGELLLSGKRVSIRSPEDAVRQGIGMVPEDRKADGLLLSQAVYLNATLATHDRFSRSGWMNHGRELRLTAEESRRLSVRYAGLDQPVEQLSGGNQQKIVMIRWILRECRVLLLDEPTRGIDMQAKETIYGLLRELAAGGKALIVVSSELPELMGLCHRIAVLSDGRLVATFPPDDWSEERITEAAFHHYSKEDVS